MIVVRKAEDRGRFDHGWLETRHTFSFADYYDPKHMGFRTLRVINDDRVQPAAGFPTHPHRDMEIITYVLDGALAHKDSLGHSSVIRPGDVQRMTAGTGITHSEWNESKDEPLRLLQLWVLPSRRGLPAGYEQRHFPAAERQAQLRLLASADGRDGSVTVNQDVAIYGALLGPDQRAEYRFADDRHGWLQVARGSVRLNGQRLDEGDGAAISNERHLVLDGIDDAELLLLDLA